jgi:hypothetical protein
MKRRRQRYRKYWVHPILRNRLTISLYVTLYPSLRNYEPKYFNYFRCQLNLFNLVNKQIRVKYVSVHFEICTELLKGRAPA